MIRTQQISPGEVALVAGLFDQYRVFYRQPSDPALATRFLGDRLQQRESVIFVALEEKEGGSQPIGFTQLYPQFSSVRAVKDWVLNDLFVSAEHRQKGAGAALIRAAIDFATAEGASFLQLETATDNHNAQRLYEAIGFRRQEPDTGFFIYRLGLSEK